VKVHLLTI